MATVRTSIDIAASPERVWELVTDLGRLDEWVSIHRDFPTPPPSDVAEGTSFAQTLSVAGTPFAVNWTATEVAGPQRLSWQGTGPAGATAHTTYSLAPSGDGTRFDYDNEFRLPAGKVGEAVSSVVSGQAEREANASLARLKALAEA